MSSTSQQVGLWVEGFGAIGATLHALEEQGATPEDLRLIRSKPGIARRVVLAVRNCIELPNEKFARLIMGEDFSGREEWGISYGGVSFTAKEAKSISSFPWSQETLQSECPFNPRKKIFETHFAFVGVKRYNGTITEAHGPLTMMGWQKIHPNSTHPRFFRYGNDCWYPNQEFATVPLELQWYLALKEIVPRSHNTSWDNMQNMIPDAYYVPSPVEETSKIVLYYKKNLVYLNRDHYVATSVLGSDGYRVIVGYCGGGGLDVGDWLGRAVDRVGLSLFRKPGM